MPDLPPDVKLALMEYRCPDDHRDATDAAGAIEVAKLAFDENANPVYAWMAFAEARQAGLEIPEWVLAYLDGVALGMWRLFQAPPPPDNVASAVADAVDAKRKGGGPSIFKQARNTRWIYLGAMADLYIQQGDKPNIAWLEVAQRNGTSQSTVMRAWKRYRATFKKSST